MANRRFPSQFNYNFHMMPVLIDCKFKVLSTAGIGISNLSSPGISSVLMHSSSASGNNLAAGQIQIQLQDSYYQYYWGGIQFTSPPTGSEINLTTGLTLGQGYQITTVGTSTAANWVTAGLQAGLTPTVGMAFVAKTAAAGTGTGKVKAVTTSGVYGAEFMGSPTLGLNVANQPTNGGGILLLQCIGPTDSTHPGPVITQPADGTAVHLWFYVSNSSVTLQGD